MPNLTPEDIAAAIAPRSDQLNADDIIGGPITVKIIGERKGDEKQPIVLDIEGWKGKPWKPCKTMSRIMAEVWREDDKPGFAPWLWVGQTVTLFRDPTVKMKGDTVGGIRLGGMTGLTKARTFEVTVSRGTKKKLVIQPIKPVVEPTPQEQDYIIEATELLNEATSLSDLQTRGEILKDKSDAIREAMKPVHAKRWTELKQTVEGE